MSNINTFGQTKHPSRRGEFIRLENKKANKSGTWALWRFSTPSYIDDQTIKLCFDFSPLIDGSIAFDRLVSNQLMITIHWANKVRHYNALILDYCLKKLAG